MSVTRTDALNATGPVLAGSRRILTTVLVTDIVDSTGRLMEVGDRSWAQVLSVHHARFRDLLGRFDGREIDDAGDGFLAAFDLATKAVTCADALHRSVADLGLEVRSGLHTGECDLVDGRLRGVAVHVGARIAALAAPGEVLVSATVFDVVQGARLHFEDRGLRRLRGLSGARRVFAARLSGPPPPPTLRAARPAAVRVTRHRVRGDEAIWRRRQDSNL